MLLKTLNNQNKSWNIVKQKQNQLRLQGNIFSPFQHKHDRNMMWCSHSLALSSQREALFTETRPACFRSTASLEQIRSLISSAFSGTTDLKLCLDPNMVGLSMATVAMTPPLDAAANMFPNDATQFVIKHKSSYLRENVLCWSHPSTDGQWCSCWRVEASPW